MKTLSYRLTATLVTAVIISFTLVLPAGAHECEQKIIIPGFRPPTDDAAQFVQRVGSSKIAVFPSIVRTVKPAEDTVMQVHSRVALNRVVDYLDKNGLGTAEIVDLEFEIGQASKGGQFAVFNETMQAIGRQLDRYEGDADYMLVLDFIRVNTRAWGIQCYVLDPAGRNVFSFLLNSHHQALVDADICVQDESAESKKEFVGECTGLALTSLKRQIKLEREIAAYTPDPAHAGRYVTNEEEPAANYIELKPDGSFRAKNAGHPMEGRYAVVSGNTLVLVLSGQGNIPVGRLEHGRLVTHDGRTAALD